MSLAPRRPYYSQRNPLDPLLLRLDLVQLKALFLVVYKRLNRGDYFQQAFGYECVDGGENPGTAGDPAAFFLLRLRRPELWPVEDQLPFYPEDVFFDVIELLHDVVSKPMNGFNHTFDFCGWHYTEFDQELGRQEYRDAINEFLPDYENGYELSTEGEILRVGDTNQSVLLTDPLPELDPENVERRVEAARDRYRRYGASYDDRREAIRSLAEVLEFLRPKLKGIITSKDDDDLFNIANNFGIRHHNERQKTDYDQDVWFDWIFYYYLNTIFMVTRKLAGPPKEPEPVKEWWDDDMATQGPDLSDVPF